MSRPKNATKERNATDDARAPSHSQAAARRGDNGVPNHGSHHAHSSQPAARSGSATEQQSAAMKKGWQTKALGAVCEVMNGGTPKTGVPEYWDGSHLWITPAEMGKRLSPYVGNTERKITGLGLRNSSAQMLPPHSVILSSRAPIGHLVINTEPMATNQGCKGLIPGSQLQHKFLYYYLSSIIDLLNLLGTGATFKELSGGKLKEVTIPVPPLPEQQRIVGILDEAFAGIATAKANAGKNLQNARALFESHLQSVFTQRGPGWVEKRLDAVAEFSQGIQVGLGDQSNTPGKGLVRFIRIIDYTQGTDDVRYVKDPGRRYWADKSDIVMVRYGTPGLVGRGIEGVIANNLFKISILDASLTKDFLAYFLGQPTVQDNLSSQGSSTMPALTFKQLGAVAISFPQESGKQNSIVFKLDSLRDETQRLARLYERKLAALDALQKSLLHQAFTGEL